MSNNRPPQIVEVEIEVPRGGFVKSDHQGRMDYVSPLPSPFNYGGIVGSLSADGGRADALVMGKRLERGVILSLPAVATVRFIDAGIDDPKWICSESALTARQRAAVRWFFRLYAVLKGAMNHTRGHRGTTSFGGIREPAEPPPLAAPRPTAVGRPEAR
jgi:inorganic pyrophosphatase